MTALALLVTFISSAEPRGMSEVSLLYFNARWCHSCATFEAQHVLDEVHRVEPALTIEHVDVDTAPERVAKYGVEFTPTLVLVDKDGFVIARPRIDLTRPRDTIERILSWVGKATGRKPK